MIEWLGTDMILKWARTPPSASWRFDSGSGRERAPRRDRSPRRGGRSVSPRRGREYSPRKDRDDRRDRDYDRRDDRRSRSPDDRDREMKDSRDREEERENGTNGEDRKGKTPPFPNHTLDDDNDNDSDAGAMTFPGYPKYVKYTDGNHTAKECIRKCYINPPSTP